MVEQVLVWSWFSSKPEVCIKQINIKPSSVQIEKAWQFNVDDWVLIDTRHLWIIAGNN